MADVNANINIGINTSAAVGSLRALQSQISQFNQSLAASNAAAAASQRQLTSNLAAQVAATRAFSTSFQKIESNASRLQTAIDKNRLSLGEYFRYGVASSGVFGRIFRKEHNEVMDLAADRVKRLQTQYLALGRAQNGFVDTMAVRPLQLHNADAAVSIQRQQLFNKLLRDGGTSMVNWGKNTQWAGRQLMVGFTVPLTIFGGYAASIFMDLDKQITQFKRVYGDAMTPTAEADAMVSQIQDIAKEYTKYGITVADSIEMASKAAATGLQQEDLLAATEEALRLATLGQIDYQQALDATISLQSAFDISSKDLATTIDFLNATENQTIVSLDDISQAIPRVAPVIRGLGGDVRDLAAFLAAMREGGVNAAEGANALKSGLASLINPSKQANEVLKDMGINIDSIVKKNEGDLMGTVQDFAFAIKDLSNLDRQKALATLFGKYQFARMGALFKNIIKDGSQAQRVIELAGLSVKELADLSEKDLGRLEESVSVKFLGAVERLKLAIAPIGEEFLKIATPIIEWVTEIFEKFNNASPEIKKWALMIIGALGGILPIVVMVAGLFGNFLGSMVKGSAIIKTFLSRVIHGGRSVGYMEGEMLDATAASKSLQGASDKVTSALNVQKEAVEALARAYQLYLQGAREALTGVSAAASGAPLPPAPGTGGALPTRPTSVPAGLPMPENIAGMIGRSAWGLAAGQGAFVNVDLTQAKEDAHFIRSVSLTAEEIDRMLADPNITQQQQENLRFLKTKIQETGDSVRAYTNEVVSIPANIHRQLTDAKKVMIQDIKPIMAMEKIHAQFGGTMLRLMPQGMDPARAAQEVETATRQLATILTRELEALETQLRAAGQELSITSEQFERMVQAAYTELRATGSTTVQAAIDDMRQIRGYSTSAGSERTGIPGAGFYKNVSDIPAYYRTMGAPDFATSQRFDISRQLMALPGFGGDIKQVQNIFKNFSMEAKTALLSVKDDVVLFTAMFINEMAKAGVQGAAELAQQFDAALDGRLLGAGLAAEINAGLQSGVIYGPDGRPISTPETRQPATQQEQEGGRPVVLDADGRPMQSLEDDAKKAGKELDDASKEGGGRIRKGAKAFGNALLRGSGKLQGGLFALDGLAIGLSFLDNQIGEFANKIMPAIFAFQGLTMMLPMFTTPLGAAIGAIGLIAGSAIGFNMAMDMARDKMQQMAQSMIATRETIDAVGEFYGRESIAAARRTTGLAESADVEVPQIEKAREFLASDVGQQLFNGLQDAIQQFGVSNSAKQFAANLSSMVLQGVMTPQEAKSVAAVVGEQLGNETFGIMVQGQLKSIIGPNGKKLEDEPLSIALAIDKQNAQTVGMLTSQVEELGASYEKFFEFTQGDFGAFAIMTPIGGLINAFNKFTLGWDNFLGDAARWARGTLNLDNFEDVNAQLETMAMFVGNQLAQGYENLAAAQERILGLEERARQAEKTRKQTEKAREEDPTKVSGKDVRKAREEEYDAEAAVRIANRQEQTLMANLQRQKTQMVDMYMNMGTEARGAFDRGLSSSVAEMYKDMPGMQQFYDIIDWTAVPDDKRIRLQLEMASGAIDPMTFNALISSAGGTEKATDIVINLSTKFKGDTAKATEALQAVLTMGLGSTIEQRIVWDMQARSAKGVEKVTETLNSIAAVPDEDLRKQLSLETVGATPKELESYEKSIDKFNKLPPKLMKEAQVVYEQKGMAAFQSVTDTLDWYAKLDPKDLNKEATIKVLKKDFELTEAEIEEWKNTPTEKKLDLLLQWSTEGIDPEKPPEIPEPEPVEVETEVEVSPTIPPDALSTIDSEITNYGWSNIEISADGNTTLLEDAIDYVRQNPGPAVKVPVTYVATNSPSDAKRNEFTGGLIRRFMGGIIRKLATGGEAVPGGIVPGDGGRDSIPALLTPGEFVIRKASVDKYGEALFRALNMGAFMTGGIAKFHKGGGVRHLHRGDQTEDLAWHAANPDYITQRQASRTQASASSNNGGNGENWNWVAPPKTGEGENAGEALKERIKEIKDALENFTRSLYESTLIYTNINTTLKDVAKGTKSLADQILRFGNSLITSLRATGMSETAVQQIISMGAEEAKAWFQKYTNKKGQLTKEGKQQVTGMNAAFVGEQMSGYVGRARTAAAQRRVMTSNRNISDDVRQEIANDPQSAQAYVLLLEEARKAQEKLNKAKPGTKEWKKANGELKRANAAIRAYEKKVKAATDAEKALAKALDPVAWGIEQIDKAREATLNQNALLEAKFAQAFGEMERAAAPGIKASKERINALEDQIEAVQDEIDAIEELNEADQQLIRGLERQKELIGRQIEDLEYANELDQRKIDAYNRQKELINRQIAAVDRANELDQRRIDALDRQKEMLGRQLEVSERANELDQRRIDALDRQKEMINRQIQSVEDLNEKDQQKISDLQREDEMRNRISESLNRDLELMSRREQDIQKSYDKRIQSLEKVSKINDHIINQQKSQLGIARALSQGDIYAATEAMEQRRQQQIEFSREQTRTALETGKQNAIASLRTAGGLTREQAEQQIQQIGDQNYQNSLAIRDVEDQIYARNESMIPLKEQIKDLDAQILTIQDGIYERNLSMIPVRDQMYEIDQLILGIQDQIYERNLSTIPLRDQIYAIDEKILVVEDGIYNRNLQIVPLKDQIRSIDQQIEPIADRIWNRETQIYEIQKNRLDPLQKALEKEQDSLESQEEALENAKANLVIDGLTYEQLQNQIAAEEEAYNLAVAQIIVNGKNVKAIEKIVDAWKKVGRAIAAANRTAQDMSRQAQDFADQQIAVVEASEMTVTDKQAKINAIMTTLQNRLKEIENQRKAAIEQARNDAVREQRRQGKYAGGMIKRYAAGSIVPGDGSRDSVLAKLTPGEYVIRKAMVKKYGEAMLNDINTGSFSVPKYKVASFGSGNLDSGKGKTEINAPVYNTYSVNVNVPNANVNADEVANKVMHRIRSMDNASVRNYRGF